MRVAETSPNPSYHPSARRAPWRRRSLAAACIAALPFTGQAIAEPSVVPIPAAVRAKHDLASFYKKTVVAPGVPVFSSDRPEDAALLEAKRLVDRVLEARPRLVGALTAAGLHVTVMASDEFSTDVPEHSHLKPKRYWDRRARGLGGTIEIPVVSCGEENLLHLLGDPYRAENILLHEFAHSVHLVGMARLDATFDLRLTKAYQQAKGEGLWRDTYAISNAEEYFAEGTQTWFECNANVGPVHAEVNSREALCRYDPRLADLLTEAYGENPWRYARDSARRRSDSDRSFAWPANLADPAVLGSGR